MLSSRRFALSLVVCAVGLHLGGVVGYAAAGELRFRADHLYAALIVVTFSAVGVLVATHHPRNAIGWIFLLVAVFTGLRGLAQGYVEYRLGGATGPVSALVATAATYAEVAWIPFVLVPPSFLVLLFPDGHLPSRRWRPVAWAAAVGFAGIFATSAMIPGPLVDFPELTNRYGVDGLTVDVVAGVAYLLMMGAVIGAAASAASRFRHGSPERRQQIKWLALAGALTAVVLAVNFTLYDVLGADISDGLTMLAILSLAVAVGVAILRHRLYDIDVVINRTLVYTALTATLAATYLGSVLVLQFLLSGVTPNNSLAIAASTLAAAALFQPARRRIQSAVDRRFFRSKYDAQRTLERFGAHLRDEVDLDALGSELQTVIAETMSPATSRSG